MLLDGKIHNEHWPQKVGIAHVPFEQLPPPDPFHYVCLKNPVEPGAALFRTKCNKQEGIYCRALRLNKEVAGFYGSSRRRWTVG